MTLHRHEGLACDAVIQLLESRHGDYRQAVRFPERERHRYPVEVVCAIGGQLHAFEHTLLEPFNGHMQIEAEAKRKIQPIIDAATTAIPVEDEFELQLPFDGLMQLYGAKLDAIQRSLVQWIVQTAPTLPLAPSGRRLATENSSVPGVPFRVRLYRLTRLGVEGITVPRFGITLVVPDLEQRRLARMRKALEDKCPKLYGWKADYGARTVLICEQNDIHLTNPHFVTDVLLEAERELAGRADEVYLAMTCINDCWRIFPLRVDGRSYLDISDPNERASEVDPAGLLDITGVLE